MRSELVVTHETCNQRCGHCTARRSEDELAWVQTRAVLARVREAATRGAKELVLTGGEPAMRTDLAALVAGPAGARVYNVGDGNPVTKEALARWIAERLGQPAPVFDPSAPAGPRVAKGGRTQPSRIVATGRIRSELGWKPAFADVFAGLAPFLG